MTIKISQLGTVASVQGNVLVPVVSNITGTQTTVTANVDVMKTFITASAEANIVAANAATVFANTLMKSYVTGQITAANAGVTAANVGMTGYVDQSNSSLKTYVDGQITAANSAVVAANLGMKGYVDSISGGESIANVNMKNYVDGQITAANTGVTAANVGMVGYVNGQISTANTGMIGYVGVQVTTANIGMKGYVDSQVATIGGSSYGNSNVAQFLPTYSGLLGPNVQISSSVVYIYNPLSVGFAPVITYANTVLAGTNSANGYVQLNIQNIDSVGNLVSADFIATAPNGTDTTHYIDMGINGNNWSSGSWTVSGANDGYVYINQGNLTLGTDTAGTTVKVHVAGTLAENVVTTFANTGITVAGNIIPSANVTYSLGSSTAQWKDLWVSNTTIYLGGTPVSITNGSLTVNGNAVGGSNLVTYGGNVGASSITFDTATGAVGNAQVVDPGNGFTMFGFFSGAGGSGTGLSIVPQGSNLFDPIQFNTRGSGYRVGDIITVVNDNVGNGYSNATIVVTSLQNQPAPSIFVGNSAYRFGADGTFTLPGAINLSNGQTVTAPSATSIKIRGSSDDSGAVFDSAGEAEIYANANVYIYSDQAGSQKTWNFTQTGNLVFPDSTIQTTAFTGSGSYSNVQVATYLPTHTGNVAAGNVKVSSAYRFETGNVTITNESGHATLNPDTTLSGTAGVKIGGSGFLLGPNSARNLTLNYGGISGALGIQANVTIGTGGSGNLWVIGNVIARDITGGNILTNGSIRFADTTVQTTAWTGTVSGGSVTGNVAEATLAYAVNISPVLLNQEYPLAILPSTTGAYGIKSSDGTLGFTFNPARNRMIVGNIQLGADGNIRFADGTTQTTAANYGNTQVAQYLPSYSGTLSAGFITVPGTTGKIGFDSSNFAQQTTSNSTQVTSNTTCGNIQLMNINLGAHGVHTVAFACNQLTTNDVLLVKHISGGVTSVYVDAYVASNGLAVIWLRDITGSGTGNFTPMLKYFVIQAPN